jgi:cell division protease FtsH
MSYVVTCQRRAETSFAGKAHTLLHNTKQTIMTADTRQSTMKALLIAALVGSTEAFTVVNTIRQHSAWTAPTSSQKGSSFARPLAAAAAPSSQHRPSLAPINMSAQNSGFSKQIRTLAAMLSAAAVMVGGANSPAIAASVSDTIPNAPAALQGQGSVRQVNEVRYSDFIESVEEGKIEKVSFSSDGQKLQAIDTDGNRLRMDAIPNDPELLSILTKHQVDVTVMPATAEEKGGGVGGVLGSLAFPAILLGGLFLLSRRNK